MGGRVSLKNGRRPHERGLSIPAKPSMLRDIKADQKSLSSSGRHRLDRLPLPRRTWRRTERQTQRHVSSWAVHEKGYDGAANASSTAAAIRGAREKTLWWVMKVGGRFSFLARNDHRFTANQAFRNCLMLLPIMSRTRVALLSLSVPKKIKDDHVDTLTSLVGLENGHSIHYSTSLC
jgi:hypothetical protein